MYLHNHVAEVTLGVELARRFRDENRSPTYESIFRELVAELEGDRQALRIVLSALAFRQHAYMKEALSWLSARLHRLQFGGSWLEPPSLRRVLELEGLRASVAAKAQLWSALRAIQAVEPGLQGFDFDELRERAVRQEARVVSLHSLAVEECFDLSTAQ